MGLLGYGATPDIYSGLLSPDQQQDMQNRTLATQLGAIGAASGPSRLPVTLGSVLGQGVLAGNQERDAYLQNMLRARGASLQNQGLETQNALNNLTLQGYQRMQAANGYGPPTTGGANAGAMGGGAPGSPYPSIIPQAAPATPNTAPPMRGILSAPPVAPDGNDPSGPMPIPAPASAPPVAAGPGPQMPPQSPQGGQPAPLFNVANLRDQYRIAAATPGMSAVASQLIKEINKGVPEGAYLGTDGSINARPGYGGYVTGKAYGEGYGKSQGELPADITKIGAQAQADINKAGPIAWAQVAPRVWGDLRTQEGAARFDTIPVRDPQSGQTYNVPKTVLMGGVPGQPGAAPVPQPAPNLSLGGPYSGNLTPTPAVATNTPQPAPPPNLSVGGGLPGKLELSPEQEGASKALGEQSTQIINNEAGAGQTLERVGILRNAANQALRPGATGGDRAAFGRTILDLYQMAGAEPPTWAKNASLGGDVISKIGGQMTTDLVRTLGTREALGVYNAVSKFMPNTDMSTGGFDAVLNSIQQGAVRSQDLGQFRREWLASGHSSIDGMQAAFEKQYPPELYASRIWPLPIPSDPTKLIPNANYRNNTGVSAMWTGNGFKPVGGG